MYRKRDTNQTLDYLDQEIAASRGDIENSILQKRYKLSSRTNKMSLLSKSPSYIPEPAEFNIPVVKGR